MSCQIIAKNILVTRHLILRCVALHCILRDILQLTSYILHLASCILHLAFYILRFTLHYYTTHSPMGLFSYRLRQVLRSCYLLRPDYLSLQQSILRPTCLVGGNQSARRKPTTFGRVLTDTFDMSPWRESNSRISKLKFMNFRSKYDLFSIRFAPNSQQWENVISTGTFYSILTLQSVSKVFGQMPQNLWISTNVNPPAPCSMSVCPISRQVLCVLV